MKFLLKVVGVDQGKDEKIVPLYFDQDYGYKTNSFVSVLNELKLWRHQVIF